MRRHKKLDLWVSKNEKTQNLAPRRASRVEGVSFCQWTHVLTKPHKGINAPTIQQTPKCVGFPLQSKPVYFRPVTQKPQRHTLRLISAHIPVKTRRAPKRAPWRSACHFQLVPQRQSSARKVGDGRSLRNSSSTPLALKYGSGEPRLTGSLLQTPDRRSPRHWPLFRFNGPCSLASRTISASRIFLSFTRSPLKTLSVWSVNGENASHINLMRERGNAISHTIRGRQVLKK